jgi:parallel beta-helix repeat protein
MDNTGKTLAVILTILCLSAIAILPQPTVKAQTKTIVVPDNYSTIASAIGNATNGDTILIRSGTYEGPIDDTIVIKKSVSIIGESAANTVINLHPAYNSSWILTAEFFTYTDAIRITTDNCALINLKFSISNPGGYISALGNRALIADNIIVTSPSTGLVINGSNCRITNNAMNGYLPDLDGGNIQVFGSSNQIDQNLASYVYINNGTFNYIKDNSVQGLHLLNSTNNALVGNKIVNNFYGDSGIDLKWSNNNWIYKNKVYGTIAFGFRLWFSSNNIFKANTVSNMELALTSMHLGASNNNLFSLNNFLGNTNANASYVYDDYSDINYHGYVAGFSTCLWSENNLGNYWGDYKIKYPNATAIDNTQVGNTPYVINTDNTDAYPLMSNYDVSSVSIELPDWATSLNVPAVAATPTFPAYHPTITPTQTGLPSPTSTVLQTAPTLTSNMPRDAPHLEVTDYLLPVGVIAAIVAIFSVLLFRRHRKTTNLNK